ncbi:hypothetical protein E4T50_07941 [Aureobasidium sp. EXF-12298]|nr:hypothetical protein E4T50_07941 [Aureobasidium sp. EXF-12298]KAI4765483.1 hypothetical protein E4T51_01560 [Aureobasidium sp. EXF-12344]KAI4783285.1 hypothetical protein E4T52_01721 [Aureobasidium sp. EXF-3400]
MTSETMAAQRTSAFLMLPAELRNAIYALLLKAPAHVKQSRRVATRGLCSDYILPPLDLCPALLRTCKQIHNEAASVLYGANQFASHPSLLTALPYLMSPRQPITEGPGRWKIQRWYIYLRLDVDVRFTAEQLEQAFSGAEELEVEYFQPAYGYGDNGTLKLFEGIRGVGLAKVVGGSGCDAEYARSLEAMIMRPMHAAAPP